MEQFYEASVCLRGGETVIYVGDTLSNTVQNTGGLQMHPTPSDVGGLDTNRTLSVLGAATIVVSLVVALWLATSVGAVFTAVEMSLFVVLGLILIALGRSPDAER